MSTRQFYVKKLPNIRWYYCCTKIWKKTDEYKGYYLVSCHWKLEGCVTNTFNYYILNIYIRELNEKFLKLYATIYIFHPSNFGYIIYFLHGWTSIIGGYTSPAL